jgi:hypothetical protein
MSDTRWRISGGLGVPDLPGQVMTQGLGFPLRPVDGVPAQDTGESLEGIAIAEGLFMQWMGSFQAGLVYPEGSVVLDEGWTMIANVTTVTKPAPQPVGDPTWALPDVPAFITESELAVIYSGHEYTFSEPGWIKALRVWAPELTPDTHYRVIIADVTDPNKIVTSIIDNAVLAEDAWQTVALSNQLIPAGTVMRVYLDALNSGADSAVNGGWTYNGTNNAGLPPVSGWNHSQQQNTLSISKTDLDSTDRESELLGMGPGTTIVFAETEDSNSSFSYRVNAAPIDNITYVTYAVELTATGPSGAPGIGTTTSMTAAVPVAQTTEYAEIAGSVPTPTWATVTGILEFNGVDQGGAAYSYGVDLEFDAAEINSEWDVVSFAGA